MAIVLDVKDKAIAVWFVVAKVWDVNGDVLVDARLQGFARRIARIAGDLLQR